MAPTDVGGSSRSPVELRASGRRLAPWSRLHPFQELARFRVHDILLVSSLYDSYILAEDGQLSEAVLSEFLSLDLFHAPRLTRVSTGFEALALALSERRYNLIIATTRIADMRVVELARKVTESGLRTPVIALAYDARDLAECARLPEIAEVDRVFLWQGDVRILPAIVKYVEDRINVASDTGEMGVQAIILIEDSVRYYSSFLPVIYTELLRHSQRLVPEGVNLSHKLMRLQARPKILLCGTFEEAWRYFELYEDNILGVISDIEFPRDGALSPEAGVEFARRVRERQPDVPVMLQSSDPDNEALARAVGAAFLLKESPTLLEQLRQFMVDNFGFGDFIFKRPTGEVVGRASDLRTLEERLRQVPADSIAYHAERNHFSRWLKARTEFTLAHYLRPRKVSEFATLEDLRHELVRSIHQYREEQRRGLIADFDPRTFEPDTSFCRLGGGSLGGKGRGLAFVNAQLADHGLEDRFPGVRVVVPPAVILGTDVFDEFLDLNDLRSFAIECPDDRAILARFLQAHLPEAIERQLAAFVSLATYPLAVRSSSLLEDSPYQPFAGVYETRMVRNQHPSPAVRLAELREAILRVYASTFSQRAKAYLDASPYRLEEEKMAVVIQKIAGARHGSRLYPDIAGVATSHNFYPVPPMKASDGLAAVALGLGIPVVGGDRCVRFCPRYPRHLVPFSSVEDVLRYSQRVFYALSLEETDSASDGFGLSEFDLAVAEADGTLAWVGSTYSPENDALYDGVSRPGVRLVSFAPILKHRLFPLAELLDALLEICSAATSTPVEIEFAVTLATPPGAPREFAFLQLRPLALARELTELDVGHFDPAELVCQSPSVLGHGQMADIYDLVVILEPPTSPARSREVAGEIARLNAVLAAARRPYVLIGLGRWGSADPFLGIPVTWDQISGARVIVEAGSAEFRVAPSQGSHFFQNLMAWNVGYFTVNPSANEGFIDWAYLTAQPPLSERAGVRHLRFAAPVVVKMNGKRHQGVILKPRP
jgi:CheY-like chemotaxis protein